MKVDYLVDVWYTNKTLYVLGGDYLGKGNIGIVTPNGVTTTSSSHIIGGHTGQIRCAKIGKLNSDSGYPFLLTGGEDGRVCLWTDLLAGTSTSSSSSFLLLTYCMMDSKSSQNHCWKHY